VDHVDGVAVEVEADGVVVRDHRQRGLGRGRRGVAGHEPARREAVADARRRAATIAEALGGRLGPLMTMAEVQPGGGTPFREAKMALAAAADAPTPVLPGAVEVAVTVTGEWELLPVGIG
jgi:uncharacterized protein YggE